LRAARASRRLCRALQGDRGEAAGIAGFERTELHRNAGVGDPTYQFVNIATWASAHAWRAALPQINAAAAGGPGGVVPKAALYGSVFRFPA
jgi:hypothetical protein